MTRNRRARRDLQAQGTREADCIQASRPSARGARLVHHATGFPCCFRRRGTLTVLVIAVGIAYAASAGTRHAGNDHPRCSSSALIPGQRRPRRARSAPVAAAGRPAGASASGGVPEDSQTMVIVPTLFGSVRAVDDLLAHLRDSGAGIHTSSLPHLSGELGPKITAQAAGRRRSPPRDRHRRLEPAPLHPTAGTLLLVPSQSPWNRTGCGWDEDASGGRSRS